MDEVSFVRFFCPSSSSSSSRPFLLLLPVSLYLGNSMYKQESTHILRANQILAKMWWSRKKRKKGRLRALPILYANTRHILTTTKKTTHTRTRLLPKPLFLEFFPDPLPLGVGKAIILLLFSCWVGMVYRFPFSFISFWLLFIYSLV